MSQHHRAHLALLCMLLEVALNCMQARHDHCSHTLSKHNACVVFVNDERTNHNGTCHTPGGRHVLGSTTSFMNASNSSTYRCRASMELKISTNRKMKEWKINRNSSINHLEVLCAVAMLSVTMTRRNSQNSSGVRSSTPPAPLPSTATEEKGVNFHEFIMGTMQ